MRGDSRIAIDDMPRVQRLIPLNHRGAYKLLRFNSTEWLENEEWVMQSWRLKSISSTTHLRAQKSCAPHTYGNIDVSVYYVSNVTCLEDGAHNHELSAYVTKKTEWKNTVIHQDQFQDERLTMFVAHNGKVPEKITHEEHAAQKYGVDFASRYDWVIADEPVAKFVFKYREKSESTLLPQI